MMIAPLLTGFSGNFSSRRDGSPFMNLLMMAPLYDNRGSVRYFLGAQVDVSGLVEDGRGLETFAKYLEDKSRYGKRDNDQPQENASKRSLRTLNEFGQMLSLDESAIFQSHSRCSSVHSAENGPTMSFHARGTPARRDLGTRYPRKVLGHDETHDEDDRNAWAFSSMGPSGKLPGVYQNVSVSALSEGGRGGGRDGFPLLSVSLG